MLGYILIVSKCVCVPVCIGKFDHWLYHRHSYDWGFQKEIISVVAAVELICSNLPSWEPAAGTMGPYRAQASAATPLSPSLWLCQVKILGLLPNDSTAGSIGTRFPRYPYWATAALKLLQIGPAGTSSAPCSSPRLLLPSPFLPPSFLRHADNCREDVEVPSPWNWKDLPWPSCLPGPLASLATASGCKEGLMSLWERSGEGHR